MYDLLFAGLELMVLGMSIVFIFLVILIFSLRGMSALANLLEAPPEAPVAPVQVRDSSEVDGAVVAAISAAVLRFRSGHRHRS